MSKRTKDLLNINPWPGILVLRHDDPQPDADASVRGGEVSETVKCSQRLYTGSIMYPWRQCQRKGTLEHDGKMFCRQHHPPTKDEKRAKKMRAADYYTELQRKNSAVRAAEHRLAEAALKAWEPATFAMISLAYKSKVPKEWREFTAALDDLRRLKGEG